MALPLLIVIASLAALAAAYYYYERAIRTHTTTAASLSVEGALYRTDQSIDSAGSVDLFASSPAFTSEDDKRSPRRRYSKPHLISLPDRSNASTPVACTNPAHASHPTHRRPDVARTAPTQDSCTSPFAGVLTAASVADLFDSSLALTTCQSETQLEEEQTQKSTSVQSCH